VGSGVELSGSVVVGPDVGSSVGLGVWVGGFGFKVGIGVAGVRNSRVSIDGEACGEIATTTPLSLDEGDNIF